MTELDPQVIGKQLDEKNVANILRKQGNGKVITEAERAQVEAYVESQKLLAPEKKPEKPSKMSPKARKFAELFIGGNSAAAAYKEAYNRPELDTYRASQRAWEVKQFPSVKAYMAELQSGTKGKTILSLNDRLAILARDAQIPGKTPAMIRARAFVVKTYSDISGDRAPDRQEVTGPNGGPLEHQHTAGPLVRAVSAQARLAEMKARRAQAAQGVIPFPQPAEAAPEQAPGADISPPGEPLPADQGIGGS